MTTGRPPVGGRPPAVVTRQPTGKVETYRGRDNSSARFRPDGHVREVHRGPVTVVRSSTGSRTTVVTRPGNRVVVAHGAGRGYVQKPVTIRGQSYVHRTYSVGGRPYVRVYRPYTYRGVSVNIYTPVRYYSPGFYAYAYSPWRTPVYYRWGWAGSPWYGYYGGYFTPYPVYTSPALWLTDYMVSSMMQAAYAERMAAAADARNAAYASSGPGGLTPDVKQAIADEVQRQIQAERMEAQNAGGAGGAPMLADGSAHVFVVDHGMDVAIISGGGTECAVSEGDVLQLPAGGAGGEMANVVVLASKPGGCPKRSVVSVPVADLVEIQNRMRETLDQGMEDLRSKQGQGGLPALPPQAAMAPTQASFANEIPPPDPSISEDLTQATQESLQAEQQVVAEANSPDAGAADAQPVGTAPPVTIALGQTMDEVTAILGPPPKTVDLGPKKIYVYSDMKIIFTDGRVTDVQ
jgi:hypothetical protein